MALLYIIVHHKAMASRKTEQQLTKRRRAGKKTIILRHKSFESWCKLFHYQGEETQSSSIFLALAKYAFEESEMAPVHILPARWCLSASRPRGNGKSSVRRKQKRNLLKNPFEIQTIQLFHRPPTSLVHWSSGKNFLAFFVWYSIAIHIKPSLSRKVDEGEETFPAERKGQIIRRRRTAMKS